MSTPPPPPPPPSPPSRPTPADTDAPLRSEYANDPEMADLVEAFVTELPQRVNEVAGAFRSGNAEALKRISHQIKGSAGGYGFPSVGEAAARVEAALRDSADPTAALGRLNGEIQALVDLCCRAAASLPHVSIKRPKF